MAIERDPFSNSLKFKMEINPKPADRPNFYQAVDWLKELDIKIKGQ